ncbi:hypothetical protein LMH81_30585, partial [Vibrio lentus]|nr:hypothetical protein [Vibrio lentus]
HTDFDKTSVTHYLRQPCFDKEELVYCPTLKLHDFTLALELDSKQALPYQNRAAANNELLRFCQNQYEFAQLINRIVLDCDLALTIEPNLQMAASLKMHVLSIRA